MTSGFLVAKTLRMIKHSEAPGSPGGEEPAFVFNTLEK